MARLDCWKIDLDVWGGSGGFIGVVQSFYFYDFFLKKEEMKGVVKFENTNPLFRNKRFMLDEIV